MPPDPSELARQALQAYAEADPNRAAELCQQALGLQPDHFEALQLLGAIAAQAGAAEPAIALLARAVAVEPRHAAARSNLAKALNDAGRHEAALAECEAALALAPGFVGAHLNRLVSLHGLQRYEALLAATEPAITLAPRHAQPHMLRGNALSRLGRDEAALASYRRALALAPDDPDVNFNAALTLLRLGEYEEGLRRYEHRDRCVGGRPWPVYDKPRWDGGPLEARTIFVPWEYYRGDTLQFARYLPLLAARGARVLAQAPAAMHRLLGGLGAPIRFIEGEADPAAFDVWCPLLSLPLAFGATLAALPARTPYLHAEPERVASWSRIIGANGLKVGVCWQGSTLPYAASLGRSFPLAALRPLAAVPGVRLISLQKGDGLDQLAALPGGMRVETLADDLDAGPDAFVDTAAILHGLDLVVTCDTAVAHLAGALGRPTWLALGAYADWRWLKGRDDSPWYPSLRLFRQASPGDWDGVFAAMAAALAGLSPGRT
jgi:Flp pilus assembly protein TadD